MSQWPTGMRLRPILEWPGTQTKNRSTSQFSATWTSTLALLRREVAEVGGKDLVLQIAMREQDFRIDGMPRANAKPAHPGVILSMETKFGPMSYPCDTFLAWQDNVRAIALSLEALRKVDRYGVSKHGQQYTGWTALSASAARSDAPDAGADQREIRFWASVNTEGPVVIEALGPCWLWTGHDLSPNGYGRFWADGGKTVAHKWIWERLHGSVPAGLELDHLCQVRLCVRPSHQEPVTPEENHARSAHPGKRTHCPQGHAYTVSNTRWYRGRRYCRTCNNNGGAGRQGAIGSTAANSGEAAKMSVAEAGAVIANAAGAEHVPSPTSAEMRRLLSLAKRRSHPDRGGSRATWDKVALAERTLGL